MSEESIKKWKVLFPEVHFLFSFITCFQNEVKEKKMHGVGNLEIPQKYAPYTLAYTPDPSLSKMLHDSRK